MNERPVCHRSEDLVTYLYNEASAAEAQDFANHVETCEACRAEFAVFSEVRESILLWRNEALGSAFSPAPQTAPVLTEATTDSRQFVRHARRLPAFAALREFFSVSPLWLRGATAFATLLLCVLAALTISRMFQSQPPVVKNETQPDFSQQDIDRAVQKAVDEKVAALNRANPPRISNATARDKVKVVKGRTQLAVNTAQPRAHRLTRTEREQLAADLRLTPGRDEEELP
ncbi:MAG TPA: zf-HC2 domain-containing protein, partial [Pyrinomonadaceae bacterium]|nr:zf-HC2 domain-containing protein [Pyrinomonadaceae bacterium]